MAWGLQIQIHVQTGLRKVLSSSPALVDFIAEQVTFKACLPSGQGAGESSSINYIANKMSQKWPWASEM